MANEVEIPALPDLKIIQDGKQVDTSAIENFDEFMSFVTLLGIASNTRKVRKYYEDRVSKGEIVPWFLDITEESQEVVCPYPCQSLYVENNGPAEILFTLHSRGRKPTPIPAKREAYFPFENHVIERFYVWCAPGTVATARVIGKY